MAIEKAFFIRATAYEIYAALERDLASAVSEGEATFEVLRRDPGRSLEMRVAMGGIPCRLTYTLVPRDSGTEVTASLRPFGVRYVLFKIITLGLRDHTFALALVQGLANLKEEIEGAQGDRADVSDEQAGSP